MAKVAFNNYRSLHKHFDDVKHDQNHLSSHIIGLAETRLCNYVNTADCSLDGYQLLRNVQATSSVSCRPPHGIAVYVKMK